MKTKFFLILASCLLPATLAYAQTTAVPGTISYQGRVYTSSGTLLGAGTPVNRTVIFRIWDSPSNTAAANLLYSESQTVTISEGEFSVLVGNGVANTTQTFGYSETSKHSSASPAVNLADVFNGATRYLSVTVANGSTIATSDSEITPRQQIVSSAFAFRSKFAESLGTSASGNSLRVMDSGNIGVGNSNPPSLFTITGTNTGTTSSTPQLLITDGSDTNERLRIGVDNTGSGSGFLQAWKEGTGAQNLLLNANGGTVGVGTSSPSSSYRMDILGSLRVRTAINAIGSASNGFGELVAGANDYNGANGDGVSASYRGVILRGYGSGTTSDAYTGVNASSKGILTFQNCGGIITSNGNDISFGVNTNETMRVTSNNRIGIGTNSPVSILTVRSAATNSWPATSGTTQSGLMTRWQGVDNLCLDLGSNGQWGAWLQGIDAANLATTYPVILNPNGGNVGIGNKFPGTRLDVSGAIKAQGGTPTGASGSFTAGFTFGSGGDTDGGLFSPADGVVTLWTNGSEKMRVDSSGNIGIGTGSPATKLDVAGSIRASGGGPAFNGWNATNGYSFGSAGDQDGGMFSPGDGQIAFYCNGTERLRLNQDGRLGIGTTTPSAPLHVTGTASLTYTTDARMIHNGAQDNNNSVTANVSIIADNVVRGGEYHVVSDVRIKNVIGRSDAVSDLATLMQIQVTDYKFKDMLAKGTRPQKKVLAQQVEEVYPLATNKSTDTVPDIYRLAKIKDGWIELATNLKQGERIKIIDGSDKLMVEVLEVEPERFRVDLAQVAAPKAEVFVFGREVKDFMTVDYDALAMLNISATQELNRKIAKLEEELAEKNRTISVMEESFEARLISLEKRLGSESPAVKPISLRKESGDQ
jgi:hypothetical protein